MEQISFETVSNFQVQTTKEKISCMYCAPMEKQYFIQIGTQTFKVNQMTYLQLESQVYSNPVITNEEIESRIKEQLNNDKLPTNEAPIPRGRTSKRQG